jgi:hypothetical protein
VLGLPLLGLGFLCRQSLPSGKAWPRRRGGRGAGLEPVFRADFERLLKERRTSHHSPAGLRGFGHFLWRRVSPGAAGQRRRHDRFDADTKLMVHLPMALHKGRPESALIICFGMGTSFRAALSWDVQTTAVELVPSVVDGVWLLSRRRRQRAGQPQRPNRHRRRAALSQTHAGKIRRHRDRSSAAVEAAGSSLLYSREFYELAKEHLKPNGILQIWLVGGSKSTVQAVLRSLVEAFPYVRGFGGINGFGAHLLGSMQS